LTPAVYCKPASSFLGKRSFFENTASYPFSIMIKDDTADSNPVRSAWMIHQVSGADESSGDVDHVSEDVANIPLHVACGYLDDMISSELFSSPVTDAEEPREKVPRFALPDLEAFGTWPFSDHAVGGRGTLHYDSERDASSFNTLSNNGYVSAHTSQYGHQSSLGRDFRSVGTSVYSQDTLKKQSFSSNTVPPAGIASGYLQNTSMYCQPTSRYADSDNTNRSNFSSDELLHPQGSSASEKYYDGSDYSLLAMSGMRFRN
jgi:hypothetical protein